MGTDWKAAVHIWREEMFRLSDYSSEIWIYTLQIYPRVYVNMFRFKPRATLGLIFFTVLIQKSEKQWKVLSGCLKNLPSGIPSGHQTFPRGCAPRESLMTLGNSLGQIFPDNHCGLSTVYTRDKVSKIGTVASSRGLQLQAMYPGRKESLYSTVYSFQAN